MQLLPPLFLKLNREVMGILINEKDVRVAKNSDKFGKELQRAYEEIDKEYSLSNGGVLSLLFNSDKNKYVKSHTISGGKSRHSAKKQLNKAGIILPMSVNFTDDDGNISTATFYTSKTRDKHGEPKYRTDFAHKMFNGTRSLKEKDKEFIAFLYVFCPMISPKFKSKLFKLGNTYNKIIIDNPKKKAEDRLTQRKRIVDVINHIDGKLTDSQVVKLGKFIGIEEAKNSNMDITILKDVIIGNLEYNNNAYNLFIDFINNYTPDLERIKDVVDKSLSKGVIGYMYDKGRDKATWGVLSKSGVIESDNIIAEFIGNDEKPELLVEYLRDNESKLKMIEEAL